MVGDLRRAADAVLRRAASIGMYRRDVAADLGVQVLLRAHRASRRRSDRAAGHGHRNVESVRDPPVDSDVVLIGRRMALLSGRRQCRHRARHRAARVAAGDGRHPGLRRTALAGGQSVDLVSRDSRARSLLRCCCSSRCCICCRRCRAARALNCGPSSTAPSALWCEVAFFSLVGACTLSAPQATRLRAEPQSRTCRGARAEAERLKLRARMVDEVFQLVRIGKHVDATAPLAPGCATPTPEHVSKDAYHVAEQALRWDSPAGAQYHRQHADSPSHALRAAGRGARRCSRSCARTAPNFTMDSAADLRTLAEYAESTGRDELGASPCAWKHPCFIRARRWHMTVVSRAGLTAATSAAVAAAR